ncbi:MAG: CoA pyrophosphatase [Planctomycetota bacterium]
MDSSSTTRRRAAPAAAVAPSLSKPTKRQAAVLVPFVVTEGTRELLLMKRPERESDPYSGQICFPGGRREPDDASLEHCALREFEEEFGVPQSSVEVLAELPPGRTRHDDAVYPFLGRIAGTPELRPNPAEVARVLTFPFESIVPELFELRDHWTPLGPVETFRFPIQGDEVWGLTAGILQKLSLDRALLRLVIE